MHVSFQSIGQLFILAIPIACVARTVVYEEVFREPREWCKHKSTTCAHVFQKKFFYLFTCEYCFSHWVTLGFLLLSALGEGPGFRLLFSDWRGSLIAFFSLVLVANMYLNVYARLKVDITSEKKAIEVKEKEAEHLQKQIDSHDRKDGIAPRQSTRVRVSDSAVD